MKNLIKVFILCIMVAVGVAMGIPSTVNATGEANPRLLVESYTITDDEVKPGEEFELILKIRNTSLFYDTYSVVVMVTDETGSVYPIYGSSDQRYIERVYARNSWDITIPLKAIDNIDLDTIPLKVTITYNDNYFIEKQVNYTMINLPVRLTGALNVVTCGVPNTTTRGTKARINTTYENNGTRALYNVTMNVSGGDAFSPISTNLYSIGGGDRKNAEVYLDCYEIGEMPIEIYFSYEDEQGEVYQTEKMQYKISVKEAGSSEFDNTEVVIVGGSVNSITFVLMAAIVIIAIVILLLVRKRYR